MKTMKKTHWLRTTLIVLVACGIAGCILAAVMFGRDPSVSTYAYASIEFSFDGAAAGIAPDGTRYDLSSLSSDEVLTAALEAAGMQDRYTPEQLRSQLTVNGVYPEKIVNQLMSYESLLDFSANRTLTLSEYHPTLYNVSLKNEFDKSISVSDLEKLLGAVMEAYRNEFVREHSASAGSVTVSYNLEDYDYPQQLTILSRLMQQSAEYASEMFEKEPTLAVNGMGFNSIYVQLNNLVEGDIARLNANITMNALTKNTTRLTTQYLFEIRNLNNELAKKQDQLKKMETLLASYDKNEIIYLSTTDSLTKIDGNSSETYDRLVAARKKVADEITQINTNISTYQLRLNDLLKSDTAAEAEKAPAAETAAETGEGTGEETAEAAVSMTQEEIEAAAKAAEEAAARQTAALEQDIQTLVARREQVMTDFNTLMQVYNDRHINDMTVSVSAVRNFTPKILSGAFAKRVLKTAGPLCAVGFMVCLVLLIISRRREQRS